MHPGGFLRLDRGGKKRRTRLQIQCLPMKRPALDHGGFVWRQLSQKWYLPTSGIRFERLVLSAHENDKSTFDRHQILASHGDRLSTSQPESIAQNQQKRFQVSIVIKAASWRA